VGHRYARHATDPRYYHSSGMMPSSSTSGNTSPSAPYISSSHYPPSHNTSSHNDRFIPTPSEIAHTYNYSGPIHDQHSSQSPAAFPIPSQHSSHHRHTSSSPILSPSRVSSTRSPQAATNPNSNERFTCEICGKTFSRSHDRKRHHETQHIASPVLHRCRYCSKEFSRSTG
jgi:hypothetical protein